MTNEFAIKVLTELKGYGDKFANIGFDRKQALDIAIKALEQQPCEDCISRAKALEMLGDEPENWTDTEKEIQEVNDYRWFKSILEELPSVTTQPKRGKWIHNNCSICDYNVNPWNHTPYCPNCGAKMNGGNADAEEPTK